MFVCFFFFGFVCLFCGVVSSWCVYLCREGLGGGWKGVRFRVFHVFGLQIEGETIVQS